MPYQPKDVVKALKKAGFVEHSQAGSHLKLKNPQGNRVIVPMHNKELKMGTFHSILKQANLTLQKFKQLL